MPKWEYTTETLQPGEDRYRLLRKMGDASWEAWHIETNLTGWREIYFKRPKPD